jgi:hypothetical protein
MALVAEIKDGDIEALLAELHSPDASRRQAAARQVERLKLRNDEVRKALAFVADKDANFEAKSAAHQALRVIGFPRQQIATSRKIVDLAIGFAGWWLINGAVWLWVPKDPQGYYLILLMYVLPINFIVMALLLLLRRWVGLGVLLTYVVNLVIGLIFSSLSGPGTICWVPCFIGAR